MIIIAFQLKFQYILRNLKRTIIIYWCAYKLYILQQESIVPPCRRRAKWAEEPQEREKAYNENERENYHSSASLPTITKPDKTERRSYYKK